MENKSQTGRRPKKKISEQIEVYIKYKEDLIENGFIKPATREIYTVLCEKLGMTAKAINVAIVRNSEKIFGVKYTNQKLEGRSNIDDEIIEEAWSHDTWVTIQLNDDEQKLFHLEEKKYARRNKSVLGPEWANHLDEIIVRETNTDCCINFVRGEVIGTEIDANGYCSECKGTILVKSFDNRRVIKVKLTEGPGEHTFKKKRRITHNRKKFLEEKLKTSFPSNVLHSLANELPLMNHESRKVPTYGALQKIRERILNESMLDPNCVNALRKMKYLPEFEGAIKEISTDPLRVIFWTKYQLMWYKGYAEREIPIVSIDATGSLVSSTNLLNNLGLDHIKLPHIFLYLIVAKTAEGVCVPIAQFLSADQRSLAISFFLQSWLLDFKVKPREIVLDDSAALLKSCVMSFASCESVNEYIQKCYLVLNGQKEALPPCFIRLDISHFVKNLHRLDLFKKIDRRVSKFYLCCIGVMIKCESFEDIKNITTHILIVANNPSEGALLNGQLLPTQSSRNNLSKLVRTHDLTFVSDAKSELSDSETNVDENVSTAQWFDEIMSEIKNAKNNCDLDASNSLENLYYLPDLNDVMEKLCRRLPLWSAVMKTHFLSPNNTASSSNVESSFNRIKNVIMQDVRLPVRIDFFMQKYLASVNGSTKLAISKYPAIQNTAEGDTKVRPFLKISTRLCVVYMY